MDERATSISTGSAHPKIPRILSRFAEHFSAKEIHCGPTPAPEGSESRDLPLVVEALAHACTAELFLSAVCVRAVCAVRAVCMKVRMLPVAVPRCPGSIR